MTYQVKIPSCSYGGEGSIEKIKEIIAKEKSQKVVVFSDEGIKATGLLDILTKQLDETGVQYHVFTDCKPEHGPQRYWRCWPQRCLWASKPTSRRIQVI